MARARLALLLAATAAVGAAAANPCCGDTPAGCVTTPSAPNPCGDCIRHGMCESYLFPGSKIISHAYGMALDSWLDESKVPVIPGYERYWKLCYSTDTMNASPAEFHTRCDQYNYIVTVAHNTLGPASSGTLGRPDSLVGVTFGGFVRSCHQ